MRFAFAFAALLASAGVACSLLLDDDGFSNAPDTLPDGAPRDDSSAGDAGGDAPVIVDPGAEIGNGSGRNGPLVVANETTVNTYAPLSADAPAGAKAIETDVAPGWMADDLVMILGDHRPSRHHLRRDGDVDLASGNVGRYELPRITKTEPKGTGAVFTLAKPLAFAFRVAAAQIIRVPEHTDVTIAVTGALRPFAWDGRVGGIVAILATGKVQIDGVIVKEIETKDPSLSSADAIAGTPLYMAPESIIAPAGIDARVDLYALGGVAYWLLTGTPPFEGTSLIEICSQHLHAAVEPPSKRLGRPIPDALEQIVLRCLAKSREDRPASAKALIELLGTAKNGAHSRGENPRMELAPSAGQS